MECLRLVAMQGTFMVSVYGLFLAGGVGVELLKSAIAFKDNIIWNYIFLVGYNKYNYAQWKEKFYEAQSIYLGFIYDWRLMSETFTVERTSILQMKGD